MQDGARRDPGEDRLTLEERPRAGRRLLVRDEDLPVEPRDVEDRRDVAVGQRAKAVDEVALEGLGRGDDDVRERLAEPLARAHERSARAEPGDEDVDAVERLGDLRARPLVVGPRVRLVSVLVQHEEPRVGRGHAQGEADGAVRAFGRRRRDDPRPVELEQPDALGRRVLRDDAGEGVALELRHHRERDPRVPARRLEELAAGLELARGLRGLDHRLRDAVLRRAGRVLALELREEPHALARREARELDERRRADRLEERRGQGLLPAGHRGQEDHRRPLDRRLEPLERSHVLVADVDVHERRDAVVGEHLAPEAGEARGEVVQELPERSRRRRRPPALHRPRRAGWGGSGRASRGRAGRRAERRVVHVLGDRRALAADGAGRVAPKRDLGERRRERVEEDEAADERVSDPEQELQRLARLERADDARAGLRARRPRRSSGRARAEAAPGRDTGSRGRRRA